MDIITATDGSVVVHRANDVTIEGATRRRQEYSARMAFMACLQGNEEGAKSHLEVVHDDFLQGIALAARVLEKLCREVA